MRYLTNIFEYFIFIKSIRYTINYYIISIQLEARFCINTISNVTIYVWIPNKQSKYTNVRRESEIVYLTNRVVFAHGVMLCDAMLGM